MIGPSSQSLDHPPLQYLDQNGLALEPLPFDNAAFVTGYRALRKVRWFDERMFTLQRQGRVGVYPPVRGQEAAQVGATLALGPRDWIAPSYRETGVAITHGIPLETLLLYWRSQAAGFAWKREWRALPFAISIGTQLTQAVGLADSSRGTGEEFVVLTTIGDGGTSEGDFHEALNFASVFKAPVIFLVQNNGWAISVPSHKQFKISQLSARAAGYGMPGITVDGNDLVAVWQATAKAVARARAGDGPTLIEAVTYRVAPHTTSDDPSRYRDDEQTKVWLERDPVARVRTYLNTRNTWDETQETALLAGFEAELETALTIADAMPETAAFELVNHVYAQRSAEQERDFVALGGTK
jgi:pyruvate dehydrogenase E1 component alpha subunit